MDPLQEQFERSNGDALIDWLNRNNGTQYSFARRAGEAPDLVYSYEEKELFVEVTAAYYDGPHAKFLWDGARDPDAIVDSWLGIDPDNLLVEEIAHRITRKSQNTYGKQCLLLVVVPLVLTSAEELEELRKKSFPQNYPLSGYI